MVRDARLNRRQRVGSCRSDRIYYAASYAVVSALALVVLLPMAYIVSASFSAPSAVSAGRVLLLPVEPTLQCYRLVMQYDAIFLGYGNTIFYTVCGTGINVAMTLLCAYPLSRRGYSARFAFTMLFVFTMLFNAGMIPNYMLMRDLRLIDTRWAMLLPGAVSAYNMVVAKTFLQTAIPAELLEASKLDGCDDFRYFLRVVLPLSKSIIAVLGLYYAVGHWNSYFNAFLYLSKKGLYPLQIFLRQILVQNSFDSSDITDPEIAQQMQGVQEALRYVIIVISSLPLMCAYPFIQKYFDKGVMIGSVKG